VDFFFLFIVFEKEMERGGSEGGMCVICKRRKRNDFEISGVGFFCVCMIVTVHL
jgi:hypothetical protein